MLLSSAAARGSAQGQRGARELPGLLLAGESTETLRGEGDFSFTKVQSVDGLNRLEKMPLERDWRRCLAIGDETGGRMTAQDAERLFPPPGLCQ